MKKPSRCKSFMGEGVKDKLEKNQMITTSNETQKKRNLNAQVIAIMLDCHLSALSKYTAKLEYNMLE